MKITRETTLDELMNTTRRITLNELILSMKITKKQKLRILATSISSFLVNLLRRLCN